MATYNGERFVVDQLRSILKQLGEDDEIVVVDDASKDKTCALISDMQDPRIKLFVNPTNQGVLQSFGIALSQATGEIIFLSDQDDLWTEGKVGTVLEAFSRNPGVILIVSDASLIDEQGCQLSSSYYEGRGEFQAGLWSNIAKCKFLGCTMAFRSTLVHRALPFPKASLVHHDVWLGCVNALVGGRVLYLPLALVEYRRHSANITGRVKFSLTRRVNMRFQLCLSLVHYWLRQQAI